MLPTKRLFRDYDGAPRLQSAAHGIPAQQPALAAQHRAIGANHENGFLIGQRWGRARSLRREQEMPRLFVMNHKYFPTAAELGTSLVLALLIALALPSRLEARRIS